MLKTNDRVLTPDGYRGIYFGYIRGVGFGVHIDELDIDVYHDQEPKPLTMLSDAAHAKPLDVTYFQPPPPTDPAPSLEELEEWHSEGGCEATDGCWVEPDGYCPHGKPSWLLKLGLI